MRNDIKKCWVFLLFELPLKTTRYLRLINTEHFTRHHLLFMPEPYSLTKNKIKAELDLSNYVTKYDLKNATDTKRHQDTPKIVKNTDLASLKSNVDLEATPVDLTKLSKKWCC